MPRKRDKYNRIYNQIKELLNGCDFPLARMAKVNAVLYQIDSDKSDNFDMTDAEFLEKIVSMIYSS